MIFRQSELRGVRVVEVEELADVRGFFARSAASECSGSTDWHRE
jgi:dTDP-4-dehydrorhamnose 3,5-epimerase-like enzyme